MVLRESLVRGRRLAIWTSLGIGCGILVHVTYSLLGLGLVLTASPNVFRVIRYAGAAYLGWLGVRLWWGSRRSSLTVAVADSGSSPEVANTGAPGSIGSAWRTGFLTNALNPKATLFFVALFPTVVQPGTPVWVQCGYGLWMAGATAAWFIVVALLLTRAHTRAKYLRWTRGIDRLLAIVFIAFALGLVWLPESGNMQGHH